MENKQEDRRSRRSRKLLKQGLLELMKEKRRLMAFGLMQNIAGQRKRCFRQACSDL